MKKLTFIVMVVVLVVMMTGCSSSWDGSDTATKDNKISADFTQIPGKENLYYCNDTKVVYWIGGSYMTNLVGDDYTTSYMTVYYASNGFPYLYDEETKKLVEVNPLVN